MITRHLPQIATFKITEDPILMEEKVNQFIQKKFEETGNTPVVHTGGGYIVVVWAQLCEIKQPPVPNREFLNINTSADVKVIDGAITEINVTSSGNK